MQLFLASASPRRAALLRQIGVDIVPAPAPNIDETPTLTEHPVDYVCRMAREKSLASNALHGPTLTADTTVHFQGEIFGKPSDLEHAFDMLNVLAGQQHAVTSAVCVRNGDALQLRHSTTLVTFRPLSDQQIRRYLATGESMDKAGGYGIQGMGGALVQGISGSYTNVVGLPLEETVVLLEHFAVPYWQSVC